jgi:hypothetical protein
MCEACRRAREGNSLTPVSERLNPDCLAQRVFKDKPCKLKEFYAIILQSSSKLIKSSSCVAFHGVLIDVRLLTDAHNFVPVMISMQILIHFDKLFEGYEDTEDMLVDFIPESFLLDEQNAQDKVITTNSMRK